MKNAIYYYIGIIIVGVISTVVIFSSMPADTWRDSRTEFTGVAPPDEIDEKIDCLSRGGVWQKTSCSIIEPEPSKTDSGWRTDEDYCSEWCDQNELYDLGCTQSILAHLAKYSNLLDEDFDGVYWIDWIGLPEGISQKKFEECVDIIYKKRVPIEPEPIQEPEINKETGFNSDIYYEEFGPGSPLIYLNSSKPVLDYDNCKRYAFWLTEHQKEKIDKYEDYPRYPPWGNQIFPLVEYCSDNGDFVKLAVGDKIQWSFYEIYLENEN